VICPGQAYHLAKNPLVQVLGDRNWTATTELTGDHANLPPPVIVDLDAMFNVMRCALGSHSPERMIPWLSWTLLI
jgi:hypothetical protein